MARNGVRLRRPGCRPVRRQADAGETTSFTLKGYAVAPGVELTGKLDASGSGFPLLWKGTVAVTGKNAAHGKLTMKRDALTGTLGGVHVSYPGAAE